VDTIAKAINKRGCSGKCILYWIAAIIAATIFFALLVEGVLTHSSGSLSVAIVEYFIAFIFLGIAKCCKCRGKECH
jgi:hypothetical protein